MKTWKKNTWFHKAIQENFNGHIKTISFQAYFKQSKQLINNYSTILLFISQMDYKDVGWCFTKNAVTYILNGKNNSYILYIESSGEGKEGLSCEWWVFFFLKSDSFKYPYAVANILFCALCCLNSLKSILRLMNKIWYHFSTQIIVKLKM